MVSDSGPSDELLRLERARCEAISRGDLAALERLLADDLTHTHMTGLTHDKSTYLAGLSGRPRDTTRADDLLVRVYGDVAVITGTLRNRFPASQAGGQVRRVELHALQVWVRGGSEGWQQVAFASSGRSAGA